MAPIGAARAARVGVLDAIPDSGDLYGHYDASEQTDVSSTWDAEVGSNLSAVGGPTVKTNEKNGLNVVSYDGVGDAHESTITSVSAPFHLFLVFRMTEAATQNEWIMATKTGAQDGFINQNPNFGMRNLSLSTGVDDLNWHIANIRLGSSTSDISLDGAQLDSDTSSYTATDQTVFGYLPTTGGNNIAVDIGEALLYDTDKDSVESDIESYLNDRWAVY